MQIRLSLAIAALIWLKFVLHADAQVSVLYVHGTHPPALIGETLQLDDPGMYGYLRFRQAVEQVGFTFDEFEAGPTSTNQLTASLLDNYQVLILSSNNRQFSPVEAATVANWVQNGGGLIAWSDASFGRDQNGDGHPEPDNAAANTGIPNTIGRDSDNSLTDQFGIHFLRDSANGEYQGGVSSNDYQFAHYIWTHDPVDGVVHFEGEGVSPMKVSGAALVLLRFSDTMRVNGGILPPALNPADLADGVVLDDSIAALAIAEVGAGRVVGAFDRNTFFNPPGVGSNIDRYDNEIFAQNLVVWAANVPGAVPLAGDYSANGIVDAADYTVWRNSVGRTGVGLAADGNGDRIVDAADYAVWQTKYGEPAPVGAGSFELAVNLPEPTTPTLLFMALAARVLQQRFARTNASPIVRSSRPCRDSTPSRAAPRHTGPE